MRNVAWCVIGLSAVTGAASAATEKTFQDWAVTDLDGSSGGVAAGTINDSGAGLFKSCYPATDACFWVLVMNSGCEKDAPYVALLNSPNGSYAIDLVCDTFVEGRGWRYYLKDPDTVDKALASGARAGLAVAQADGSFRVVRFSLTGSQQAIAAMYATVKTRQARGTADLKL